MENKGRIALTGVGAVLSAPIAYFTTKVFEAWGLLDDLALRLGSHLKKTVTPAQAGWTFGLVLYLAFAAVLVWFIWNKRKTPTEPDLLPDANSQPPLNRPPKPDIPITVLYGRVYKKLGGAPSEGDRKNDFYKKVDREIADAVVLNKLSTWGYYMDTAIRSISYQSWRNGIFNHRNKTLLIPSDSLRPMIFKDLKFNKEETDGIWPPN